VILVSKDQLVNKEIVDHQDKLVRMDSPVQMDNLERAVRLVHKETEDRLEEQVILDTKVNLGLKDQMVQLVQLEVQALQEIQALKAKQEHPDLLEFRSMVQQELLDPLDLRVL
jgi:hypothetical protein